MANEVPQEKIQELQILEQNIQSFSHQKQTIKAQQLEAESALSELKTTTESYKIIGNIMVKTKKTELISELDSKQELLVTRMNKLEKQETLLREKFETLQKEVMSLMQKGKEE